MKNNRKFILRMMMIIVAMPHYSITGLWEPAGTAGVKAADELLRKHLPIITKLVQDLSDSGSEAAKVAGDSVVEASANIGIEATKRLVTVGNAGIAVLGLGIAAYSIVQLYPIGKEIASTICPSAEQKIQKAVNLKSAQKKLHALEAEEAFRGCLIKNRNNPDRGASGLPSTCEAVAETFALLGNYKEVEQTTAYFNKYRG